MDTTSGEILDNIPFQGENSFHFVNSIDWSPDGARIAIGTYVEDDPGQSIVVSIRVWDLEHKELIFSDKTIRHVRELAWHEDGRRLAVTIGEDDPSIEDGLVIWDVDEGKRIHTLVGHERDEKNVILRIRSLES